MERQAIITSKIFEENPDFNPKDLLAQLESLLDASVFIIPHITNDMTGHADGHVRFLSNNTVLVNELKNELKYWRTGFLEMIKESGLDYMEVPWFHDKSKRNLNLAIGYYINYLDVGNLIVLPVFEVEGNRDQEALDQFKTLFPDRKVETVNINEIGEEGGLLNCVSWGIYDVSL